MSLNPFVSYRTVKVGNIPEAKLKKALDGLTVRLTNADLSGDRIIMLHPTTVEKIKKAQKMNKGTTINITPLEAMHDLKYHETAGEGMHGGSLFKFLRKKVLPYAKKFITEHWDDIKPFVSALLDRGVPAVASMAGVPEAGDPTREIARATLGVGVRKSRFVKGSQEAKDYMDSLRAKRAEKGGSPRMP